MPSKGTKSAFSTPKVDLMVVVTIRCTQLHDPKQADPRRGMNANSSSSIDSLIVLCSLSYLWDRLAAHGQDVDKIKRRIDEVVLKCLVCVDDQIPYQVKRSIFQGQ